MEARTSDTFETNEANEETTAPASQGDLEAAASKPAVMHREIAEWHGRDLVDRDGERIGKLEDVYFDVETDEPQFESVKEGFIGRHLTFVPLTGITIGPDNLQVPVTKEQVNAAPSQRRPESGASPGRAQTAGVRAAPRGPLLNLPKGLPGVARRTGTGDR